MGAWRHLAFSSPSFDSASVRLVSEKLADALTRSIRRGLLPVQPPPGWARARPAIDAAFGTDLSHHLFRVEPVAWVSLTETQITGGFAQFLRVPNRRLRLARARPLLTALGVDLGEAVHDIHVEAEVGTAGSRNRRIDLLVTWEIPPGTRYAAVVEAKLDGGSVRRRTLPAYRQHLTNLGIAQERMELRLVSSRCSNNIRRALRNNPNWRWLPWRDLLLAYDRALCGDADDDGFRQFRRTAWERAA